MSKLLKKNKLPEDNSYHISQMKASTDSLIATHTAIATAHHTPPTDFYTQAEVDALIAAINEASAITSSQMSLGDSGFVPWTTGWSVAHSDNNARVWYTFVAPSTDNYKVRIYYFSSERTASGKIYAGATAFGEVYSLTNIFNGVNFDLSWMGVANEMGYTESAQFAATEGEFIHARFNKDANDGAGTIYVIAGVIVIQ